MKRSPTLIAVLAFIISGVLYAAYFWINLGNAVGYSPEQPIPFSHQRHAGDNQIPCLYCHVNADKGRHATVPSMNICMNCHSVVRANPDPKSPDYSPYIQTLHDYYKRGEPLPWVKVHDTADFVFFNHRPHIAKGIDCSSCHGDVQNMVKIEQVESLKMGFCIDCHRQNQAPMSCYTCHH